MLQGRHRRGLPAEAHLEVTRNESYLVGHAGVCQLLHLVPPVVVELVKAGGIWAWNYVSYCIGFGIGHVVIGLMHVEAITSGHATTMEIMTCFFLFPLYIMAVTTEITLLVHWTLGVYVANDFGLSAAQKGLMVAVPLLAGARLKAHLPV